MEGAMHKRSAINKEGHFFGIQWPAALVQRKSDKKILSVSRQKIRVHESAYMAKLDQRVDVKDEATPVFGEVDENFVKAADGGGAARPELTNNRVSSSLVNVVGAAVDFFIRLCVRRLSWRGEERGGGW